jgi:RimJ/RimL family protein N-acetyltransferase
MGRMHDASIDPLKIAFRPATLEDAELLLAWRNDPTTRQSSIQQAEISFEEHVQWLSRSLASPSRQLFVALYEGRAAGMVRFDQLGEAPLEVGTEASEMSWSVAPEHRGRGLGKWIVKAALALRPGTLVAQIRHENLASRKIAEFVGFIPESERDAITWWRLDR